MHKNIDQLYDLIKDLKTHQEFKQLIKETREKYDDLLDEETAALMIVDKLGRNKQNIVKINQIKPGEEHTVYGTIKQIGEKRNFKRKNGGNGRVVNIDIEDETGSCKLVLWNRDVELIKKKKLRPGTKIKLINGYVKDGYNGLEINLGRWSMLQVVENNQQKQPPKKEKTITGTISKIEPTNTFFKQNGEIGFVTNMQIKNKKGKQKISLWDEKVKEIQKYSEGDTIKIENYDTRKKQSQKELHLNSKAKIKKL
ncbi:MAG: OB-fold nucleic acid binding domain-containing protein [Candidatus Thermoplasmatota archaeon]